jgi:hypothetical protein
MRSPLGGVKVQEGQSAAQAERGAADGRRVSSAAQRASQPHQVTQERSDKATDGVGAVATRDSESLLRMLSKDFRFTADGKISAYRVAATAICECRVQWVELVSAQTKHS